MKIANTDFEEETVSVTSSANNANHRRLNLRNRNNKLLSTDALSNFNKASETIVGGGAADEESHEVRSRKLPSSHHKTVSLKSAFD